MHALAVGSAHTRALVFAHALPEEGVFVLTICSRFVVIPRSILSSFSDNIGSTGKCCAMQFFSSRLLGTSLELTLTQFCTVSRLSATVGTCTESSAA